MNFFSTGFHVAKKTTSSTRMVWLKTSFAQTLAEGTESSRAGSDLARHRMVFPILERAFAATIKAHETHRRIPSPWPLAL
jgi:hypothetical protein